MSINKAMERGIKWIDKNVDPAYWGEPPTWNGIRNMLSAMAESAPEKEPCSCYHDVFNPECQRHKTPTDLLVEISHRSPKPISSPDAKYRRMWEGLKKDLDSDENFTNRFIRERMDELEREESQRAGGGV